MRETLAVLEGLTLKRHRDLEGRRYDAWIRRALLGLVVAFLVAALFDVFGQRTTTTRVGDSTAGLGLQLPERVRGGLLFQARITVTAVAELKDARLLLDRGWADGFQINTIEPGPIGEASADGKLSFDLGHVPAGQKYELWMQFQANPTTVGRRSHDLDLYDGDRYLTTLRRDLVVLP
jgi:hypothetical protein